jgi:hypothetical membrane protein
MTRIGVAPAWARGFCDAATVAGPLAFLATTVVLESLQPGYDRVRETISSLVWVQGGWAQAVVFFLFGLTMMAFSRRLSALASGKASKAGSALVCLVGLGFIVIAVVPTSAPFQAPGVESAIHHLTVRTMSVLFPIACVLVAKGIRGDLRFRGIRTYTQVTAGVGSVLIPLGAVAVFSDVSWLGAFERLMLGNGLLWMEVVGIQLLLGKGLGREWISEFSLLRPVPAVLTANGGDLGDEGVIEDSKEVRKNETRGRRIPDPGDEGRGSLQVLC